MSNLPIIFLVFMGISFIIMGLLSFKCFLESNKENVILRIFYILNGLILLVIGIAPFGIIYHVIL